MVKYRLYKLADSVVGSEVEHVAAEVGGRLVWWAARHWVRDLRIEAAGAMTRDDVNFEPARRAWLAAVADLVDVSTTLAGGVDGLKAVEALGVDVSGALVKAYELAEERAEREEVAA